MWWVLRKSKPKNRSCREAKNYCAYREVARTVITSRVLYFANTHGFTFGRIAIKNQKRCWGSCSTKNNLNFNYKLLFLPQELLDYVVVHELCHLRHFHHGTEFWLEVEKILPNYRERIVQLRHIERTCGASVVTLRALRS